MRAARFVLLGWVWWCVSMPASGAVAIPDPNLEATIRQALGKPSGELTSADMERLVEVDAGTRVISRLDGLETAVNLETLICQNGTIANLNPISGLRRLAFIDLGGNQIADVSPLSRLENLKILILHDNRIADVAPLLGLQRLQGLDLSHNPLPNPAAVSALKELTYLRLAALGMPDAAFVSQLPKLTQLDLSTNWISNIAPLSQLPGLVALDISMNPIADLSPVSTLRTLLRLGLRDLGLSDLSFLSSLSNLELLDLWSNSISNLAPLSSLRRLVALGIDGNLVTDIGPLSSLSQLQFLSAGFNSIVSLAPLSGLSELRWLWIHNNQISSIDPLLNLPRLNHLMIRDNLLDLRSGSQSAAAIQTLVQRGVSVLELPQQRLLPTLAGLPRRIRTEQNGAITVPLSIGSRLYSPGSLVMTAHSSNPALVTDSNLRFSGSGNSRSLSISPAAGALGCAELIVSVEDPARAWSQEYVTFCVLTPAHFDSLETLLELIDQASTRPLTDQEKSQLAAALAIPEVAAALADEEMEAALAALKGATGPATVSGRVRYFTGDWGIPGVEVILSGGGNLSVITPDSGGYSFPVETGRAYTILPVKNQDNPPNRGVTTVDAALIRRHLLGLELFTSPYQQIAGDVNASSSISSVDIAWIRRLILGLEQETPDTLWAFVRSDYLFPDPSAPWGFERSRAYPSLPGTRSGQDFIAVKLGDVNGSWTPAQAASTPALETEGGNGQLFSIAGTSVDPAANSAPVRIEIEPAASSDDRVFAVVRGGGLGNLTTLQFTLEWDPAALEFRGVTEAGLPGLGEESFGTRWAGLGKLPVSWDDPSGTMVSLEKNPILFVAEFKVLKEGSSGPLFTVSDDPTIREVTVNFRPATIWDGVGSGGPSATPVPFVSFQAGFSEGDRFEVRFSGEEGMRYLLESADSLPAARWETIVTAVGTKQPIVLSDSRPPSGQRFYRVRALREREELPKKGFARE